MSEAAELALSPPNEQVVGVGDQAPEWTMAF